MHFLFLLIAFVFGLSAAYAEDSVEQHVSEEYESVPLPGHSAYMGKGISFGMGFGVYDPLSECDCMGAWQVQTEYFYTDWLSGGGSVRFFGGDLDRDVMVMYQRYRINVRFHKASEKFDLYAEPFLGLENTNISAFRKQVRGEKAPKQHYWWEDVEEPDDEGEADSTEVEEDDCQRLFTLDGFSIGLGLGAGYKLSRLFGVTGEVQVDYSFSKEVLLNVMPGVAFNLREVWPWAKRTLSSTWISFEIGGLKTFNRGIDGWSNTYFLGIQFGA